MYHCNESGICISALHCGSTERERNCAGIFAPLDDFDTVRSSIHGAVIGSVGGNVGSAFRLEARRLLASRPPAPGYKRRVAAADFACCANEIRDDAVCIWHRRAQSAQRCASTSAASSNARDHHSW